MNVGNRMEWFEPQKGSKRDTGHMRTVTGRHGETHLFMLRQVFGDRVFSLVAMFRCPKYVVLRPVRGASTSPWYGSVEGMEKTPRLKRLQALGSAAKSAAHESPPSVEGVCIEIWIISVAINIGIVQGC